MCAREATTAGHLIEGLFYQAEPFVDIFQALHTSANDLAFEDIESSEQRRCAMALPVPMAGKRWSRKGPALPGPVTTAQAVLTSADEVIE